MLWRMTVGGIEEEANACKHRHGFADEILPFGNVIGIKRTTTPADDVTFLADAASQPTADKTSLILGVSDIPPWFPMYGWDDGCVP